MRAYLRPSGLWVIVVLGALLSMACASGGGGVKITGADLAAMIEAAKSRPAAPAKADPPVVVAPAAPVVPVVVPAPADPPVVEAPAVVLANLNIVVVDAATGAGVNGAACIVNGDRRLADGAGFVNYAVPVPGASLVLCSAVGYRSASVLEIEAGDRRFPLVSSAPAAPVLPAGVVPACGLENNSGRISRECLEAVGAASADYRTCQRSGDSVACHGYVREVARALSVTQGDPRWGLIKKTRGGSNVDGYGEDVIAYLPRAFALEADTWQWHGADIIGGAGAPGARYQAGELHGVIVCETPEAEAARWCNREADRWAPVPRPQ